MEFTKLNNGVQMPMQGIGTFLLTPDEAEASATYALKNGCQLIDTANAYCNEKAVGRAMKNAGIDRKNIFLETKLWPSFYEQDDAVDKTLERFQTDYIDLLLIHQPAGNYIAGYKQMEKAYKEGKVRAIGLSNFNEEQICEILNICEVKPSVLQTEVHPYYQEKELKNSFLTRILKFRLGIRWVTAIMHFSMSHSLRALRKNTVSRQLKSFFVGIFKTEILLFRVQRTATISRLILIFLIFHLLMKKWQKYHYLIRV